MMLSRSQPDHVKSIVSLAGRLLDRNFFNNQFHDTVVLGLLKEDYEKRPILK